MGQASVLNESEIRRVFRIIETTRHVERNRLCFVLSLYSGLRVGKIAALTIGDVATQDGDARRENQAWSRSDEGTERSHSGPVRAGPQGARVIPQKSAEPTWRRAAHCIAT
jgi:integrase